MGTERREEMRGRLVLGTAALGRPAYMTLGHAGDFPEGRTPEAMERHAHAIFDAAYAGGIRALDTARSYGRGEAFVRSWLDARGLQPGAVRVSSKWGYRYVGGWQLEADKHEVKDHSLAALRAQLQESRDTLGPYLGLYQIHSATKESGVLDDEAVLDELARARDEGLQIGLSTSGPAQAEIVRRALRIRRGGTPLFRAVQSTWNLLERSSEEALREAHEAGCTVLLKEVFANGRLSPRGDAATGTAGTIARELGVGLDVLAVAAALAQPFADSVVLGSATIDQLHSHLAGTELHLPPDVLERLGVVREDAFAYWQRRASIPWS
ncbi:aldo/keto reductase [Vulgatibacter sp.]|uniref:aldo/keto reductase n=1 Tax=Vulgatibacter sp. TaxID=1971226 RepID=UPI003562D135